MYLQYFGLKEKPFSLSPDSRFLFLTKQYESALDILSYAVKERLGFAVLSGEVGTGKTTITRELLNRFDDDIETSLLVNPLISVPELLQAINRDFGNHVKVLSPQKQMESLSKFLIKKYEEGKSAVVIIDEAQNLSFEALETIRMLSNIETETSKLLQVILVGQPELMNKLGSHQFRQLNQRITVRSILAPLTFIETLRYINHRIVLAGGTNKIFFEPATYKVIYKATRGYPRLVNVLCDRTLIAAYVADASTITKDMVRKALIDIHGTDHRPGWKKPVHALTSLVRGWFG